MSRILYVLGITLIGLACLTCCQESPSTNDTVYPKPTDSTHVKLDMEDGTHRDLKKTWFEAIHDASESTNWRQIERNTAIQKYEAQQAKDQSLSKSHRQITIDNGAISGSWSEKGSINQAGSITKTAYNRSDNKLYAISAGGSIWKGNLQTYEWEILNQDLRFDERFLDIIYPNGIDYRVIASVGGLPYYFDSDTQQWQTAVGIPNTGYYEVKDQVSINNGQQIFFFAQSEQNSPVSLYFSNDFGESYSLLERLSVTNIDQAILQVNEDNDELYLLERSNYISAKISKYNADTGQLETLTTNSPISYGDEKLVNLAIAKTNGLTTLYTYDLQNRFYKSTNNGRSWEVIAQLPTTPWAAGIHFSKTNPNVVLMGAIEAFRSINGGRTWAKVNDWYEYYENQSTTLHADIMDIAEYDTHLGSIVVVASHGGISISFDQGDDFINIGLDGLNVSQYYSVRTYPFDNRYIFAGSQDQGLQWANDLDEGAATFTQFISGDYGHLQFTNYGRSLWAIYPGGWISYYPDPLSGTLKAEFELLTNNRSVWLPPIMTSPYNPNSILIAGGSLIGTSGSHIVELTVDDLSQLFANQWPYDFSTGGGEVSAISYNEANNKEVYVLTTNGKFYKSEDQGRNFTEKNMGLSEAHHLYGNTILTSKKNANTVVIGGSGYDNPAVYISYDSGESFQPMVNGLPPTSVFEMTYNDEEDYIFAATEAGPYVYSIKNGIWEDLTQAKAPNQRYWSVEYIEASDKVRFGTYGRGIWDLNLTRTSTTEELVSTLMKLYPNPSEGLFEITTTEKGKMTVINRTGNLIFIKELNAASPFKFDLTDFPDGLYYIIFDTGKTKVSDRIVKI